MKSKRAHWGATGQSLRWQVNAGCVVKTLQPHTQTSLLTSECRLCGKDFATSQSNITVDKLWQDWKQNERNCSSHFCLYHKNNENIWQSPQYCTVNWITRKWGGNKDRKTLGADRLGHITDCPHTHTHTLTHTHTIQLAHHIQECHHYRSKICLNPAKHSRIFL